MKLQLARVGIFQTRGGRQASIFEMRDGKGYGMLLPVSQQGEPETGHSWKPSGEYSVSFEGVPHMNDLLEFITADAKSPSDYVAIR
jgi:hypothetical protein